MIIDFHTHTFPEKISVRVLEKLCRMGHTEYYTDGSARGLAESMRDAGIDYSVNLPVLTDAAQVEKVNSALLAGADELRAQGIITFGGMHPEYENYRMELRRLKEHGIAGIKLHPAYQRAALDDIRMLRIIECACECGLIVLAHAGIDLGITEKNYAAVPQILHVIETLHPERFVLAHMGGWSCWEDVERDLAGAEVWLDTSFSLGALTPDRYHSGTPYRAYNMADEDFVRLARKHGIERILFGSDSPWAEQRETLAHFLTLGLTEEEKRKILGENARALLGSAISGGEKSQERIVTG